MKFLPLLALLAISCQPQNTEGILQKSAAFHGLEAFQNSNISYTFRGNRFSQKTNAQRFVFCKIELTGDTTITDTLDNAGFRRYINGAAVALADSTAGKKARSLNSVVYFASLPFRFLDAAVNAELLGIEEINDEELHKIEIHFSKNGGGEHHDDVFLAWISTENHRLVYVAYKYHTDGGGMRFRKAKTYHRIGGVTLISYENYKPTAATPLRAIGAAFSRGELKKLSDINLEKIAVKSL